MFCSEPVLKVFEGHTEIYDEKTRQHDLLSDSFFDFYYDLAYHVEPGEFLVLETEHHVIRIEANGVSLLPTPILPAKNEWLDPCVKSEPEDINWTEPEATLFTGERLLETWEDQGIYFLRFDDFVLKVIPYAVGTMEKRLFVDNVGNYVPVLGCDRHLKRHCDCGGEGEILLDFVCDYIVRCKDCKRSTWAAMNLCDAIDDWNQGELPCDLSDIVIERR